MKLYQQYKDETNFIKRIKGYLRQKALTSENVSSEVQVKNFFIS